MPDYGMWQGAERATGRAAATGMQLLQYNAQRQDAASRLLVEQDRLKLAQEQGQRQETMFQNAEKKRMEQEAMDNAWTPASFVSKNINGMPETKKGFLSMLDEGGYKYKVVGDEVYVQNKGYKHLLERLGTDTAAKKTVLGSMLTDLQTQSAAIGQQLASGEIKKPDDLKAAEEKQAAIKKQIAGIIGAQEETVRQLAVAEAKKVEKPDKTTPKGFTEEGHQVNSDERGNLFYASGPKKGQPYEGGQLKGITESGMQSAMTGVVTWAQMAPEDKEFWYQKYAADKTAKPEFYYRDPKSKSEFMSGFAQYERSLGKTGADIISGRASVDAMKKSLAKQQVNHGAMLSFVENINGQLGKIEGIMSNMVDRIGVRALDIPRRELIKRFKGSGHEAVLGAYLMEVSNEINKLSQGSQASIAVLPVESQKKWDAVHDPNLSFNELKIVLEGTREMANIRLGSVEKALADTEGAINAKAGGSKTPPASTIEKDADALIQEYGRK